MSGLNQSEENEWNSNKGQRTKREKYKERKPQHELQSCVCFAKPNNKNEMIMKMKERKREKGNKKRKEVKRESKRNPHAYPLTILRFCIYPKILDIYLQQLPAKTVAKRKKRQHGINERFAES
jgi:hypothetical protein